MKVEMKEHSVKPGDASANLIAAFRAMIKEADEVARPSAESFARGANERERSRYLYYRGQRELLSSRLWALGGEAEDDGVDDPTVKLSEL